MYGLPYYCKTVARYRFIKTNAFHLESLEDQLGAIPQLEGT